MSIAEDIVDGMCCDICGMYFVEEHGYPVTCRGCWADMTPDERGIHQRATEILCADEYEEIGPGGRPASES